MLFDVFLHHFSHQMFVGSRFSRSQRIGELLPDRFFRVQAEHTAKCHCHLTRFPASGAISQMCHVFERFPEDKQEVGLGPHDQGPLHSP